ncbi:HD family phosphohydrolase [Zavarzinia sp. CC-PAN008]|uniref:HD family phosphohydrolase n=1 Tax=Zavarzinia sp. CC-PAN008 TaxID=3243332 RepID=UPI003F7442B2
MSTTGEPAGPTGPRDDDAADLHRARQLLSATAIRALSQDVWTRWRPVLDVPILLGFLLGMALLYAGPLPQDRPIPPLDSIADQTIRAHRDVLVEDKAATAMRRANAAEASPPAYDYDPELYYQQGRPIVAAVEAMAARAREGTLDAAGRREAFQQELGVPVPSGTFDLIEKLDNPSDLAAAITFFLNIALDRMVVADRADLPGEGPLLVRDAGRGGVLTRANSNSVMDIALLRRQMQARAATAPYGSARSVRTFALETANTLARPNLIANPDLTAELRDAAIAKVEPVLLRIADGEVIIREGDRVTRSVQERLRMLNAGEASRPAWAELAALAALALLLLVLSISLLRPQVRGGELGRKQYYLVLTALAATSLVLAVTHQLGPILAEAFGLPARLGALMMPVALVSLLLALLLDLRVALLAGLSVTLLTAYKTGTDAWLVAYHMAGVLAAGIAARRLRRRSDLLRAALLVALAQLALVPIVAILGFTGVQQDLGTAAGVVVFILVQAALVAALAAVLLPVLEVVFDAATDMRLLELASADNPLLKELALRSPGTYYHSMVMANLAETAADAIGARALQCRVMALYHDIGKMKRPSYFAENQRTGNIHDRLPPELSARMIFAHIKDGIDLARKHRLGKPVIDAVTQHQGTTLLRIFYEKAKDRARTTGETIDEQEFRYPGPRPVTRESGILLLADSVEAATRALKDPAPAEVRARVASVIRGKVEDRQLDDCRLTLGDLARIEEAFARVLTLGIYHARIEYPPAPRLADAPRGASVEPLPSDDARNRNVHPLPGLGERAS